MDETQIKQILKLNTDFYNNIADTFDKTRSKPWPGWCRLLPYLPSAHFSILDIACGNGRFYDFLSNNTKADFDYTGWDNNENLLEKAKKRYKKANFENREVIKNFSVKNKYDVISAFGITHHLPGRSERLKWFNDVSRVVGESGLFFFSIWNMQNDRRFKLRAKKATELEDGDFYYNFGDNKNFRYVHIFSPSEIQDVIVCLKNNDFMLMDRYFSDGKDINLNEYFVFRKNRRKEIY